MSTRHVANVPIDFQKDGIAQLLMEVMEATDKDRGAFLYYLLADGGTNGFDDWFPDRQTLEEVALELYGVDPKSWKEFRGPFPGYTGGRNR
ncbi:MAG: hypothetical protein AB1644_10575 [Candidatus Zixiibacteriota bacterium]